MAPNYSGGVCFTERGCWRQCCLFPWPWLVGIWAATMFSSWVARSSSLSQLVSTSPLISFQSLISSHMFPLLLLMLLWMIVRLRHVEGCWFRGTGSTTTTSSSPSSTTSSSPTNSPTSWASIPTSKQMESSLMTTYLDLAIDGAEEVDPHLNLVKGRDGAFLNENIFCWIWLGENGWFPVERRWSISRWIFCFWGLQGPNEGKSFVFLWLVSVESVGNQY